MATRNTTSTDAVLMTPRSGDFALATSTVSSKHGQVSVCIAH